jgi:hypothetical protein
MNYRIVEFHRTYSIESSLNGKEWNPVNAFNVPKYFETMYEAKGWVETMKRGKVIHDLETDQPEEKLPRSWFMDRSGKTVWNITTEYQMTIFDPVHAHNVFRLQDTHGFRFRDLEGA